MNNNARVLLKASDIKEGMSLGEDLLDTQGRLMFSKDLIIDKTILKKIEEISQNKELYLKINRNHSDKENPVKIENENIKEPEKVEIKDNRSKHKLEISKQFKGLNTDIKRLFEELDKNNEDRDFKNELRKFLNKINNSLINNNLINDVELINEILKEQHIDDYFYTHSVNVGIISNLIGKWMNLSKEDLKIATLAGLVHDIGKLKIDKTILNKPEKLTLIEFEEVKKHPSYSHRILANMGFQEEKLLRAVTFHHEKEDGSGYPLGIKGKDIPIHAKIVAIADIFDAMTSNRVYKERMNPFKVIEIFQKETFGKLDYSIVNLFIKKIMEFYIGSEVLLNINEKAKILSFHSFEITKPILLTESGKFIDTTKNRAVEIIDFQNAFLK